jgi:hypothetical protein
MRIGTSKMIQVLLRLLVYIIPDVFHDIIHYLLAIMTLSCQRIIIYLIALPDAMYITFGDGSFSNLHQPRQ